MLATMLLDVYWDPDELYYGTGMPSVCQSLTLHTANDAEHEVVRPEKL